MDFPGQPCFRLVPPKAKGEELLVREQAGLRGVGGAENWTQGRDGS